MDVLSKQLGIFWRSLEIPLISCKVELKIKWTRYCVLSAIGADDVNNMILIIIIYKRHKIICSSSNFMSKKL